MIIVNAYPNISIRLKFRCFGHIVHQKRHEHITARKYALNREVQPNLL